MSAADLLVLRHGAAAPATDGDRDPGLSLRGRAQAAIAAEAVVERLGAIAGGSGPVRLLASPLRRTHQTAAIIAARIGCAVEVVPAFAEIPWRGAQPVVERGADVRDWMTRTWPDMPAPQRAWRDGVLAAVRSIDGVAVIATHFVPLNVLVGAARGSDRVLLFRPAHAALNQFRRVGPDLHVRALGPEQPDMFAGLTIAPATGSGRPQPGP